MTLRSPTENENGGLFLYSPLIVFPAQAGIQVLSLLVILDTRFRGYDGNWEIPPQRVFRRLDFLTVLKQILEYLMDFGAHEGRTRKFFKIFFPNFVHFASFVVQTT
jgi:hypothetical protein